MTIRTTRIAQAIPTGIKPSIAFPCLSVVTEVFYVPSNPSRWNTCRR